MANPDLQIREHIQEGEYDAFVNIIENNPEVLDPEDNGVTLLHAVIYNIDQENGNGVNFIEYVLQQRPDLLNMQNENGETALHAAVDFLNVDILQKLVDSGADKTIVNTRGFRPFHEALIFRNSVQHELNAPGLNDLDEINRLQAQLAKIYQMIAILSPLQIAGKRRSMRRKSRKAKKSRASKGTRKTKKSRRSKH